MKSISAIIPVHRLEYLSESIESALVQTHPIDDIFVISDRQDASDVVRPYLRYVHYLEFPQMEGFSLPEKMNIGMTVSNTDTAFTLCDDDILDKTYVEKALSAMQENNVDIVYADMELFGMDNRKVDALDWTLENFQKTTVPFLFSVLKRQVWEGIGGYKSGAYFDWDFWWTAFERGFTAYHLQEYLLRYRTHETQISRLCNVEEETKVVMERHGYS